MIIATWNVERLKHKRDLAQIISLCEQIRADVLVLTETDERVKPRYQYCHQTPKLPSDYYAPTENRVSIFTNYRFVRQHPTYDENTAICVELETERGNLLVYGTLMGIQGGRCASFKADVPRQMEDLRRLSRIGGALCVCGDFNCTFSDNYYYTEEGRRLILEGLDGAQLRLLTAERSECIDHIAISEWFVHDADTQIEEWNQEKTLSDHKGIAISMNWHR